MTSEQAPAPAAPASPPRGPPAVGPSGTREWLPWLAACAAVSFLVFLPTLHNAFLLTWDDGDFILGNDIVRRIGFSAIRDAFTQFRFHYWTPLTWLSFAVDYWLWGPEPFGFHLTNVVLHAANTGLVFLVALRLLERAGRAGRWTAALAALAWSLHPLRVEVVAWASERKSLLSLLFGLLALLAYLEHVRAGVPWTRSRRYAAALGLFSASLLAKPALVTLPVVLAILDAWPLGRPGRGRSADELAEKVPLLAAAALASVMAMVGHAGAAMPLSESGLVSRALIALRAVFDSTRLTLWPSALSPFYLHPGNVPLGDLSHLVPALLVVALTAVAILRAREHPAVATAWLAWLLLLSPGLGSTQVSLTSMADRFTYPATIPLALLAAAGAASALARLPRRLALAGAATIAALLALLSGLSVRQCAVWRDDLSLWTRPIELDPGRSGRVYTQRAAARERVGDLAGARADMDQAIAIAASKGYAYMHRLYARRAAILSEMGSLPDAIADCGLALQSATSHDRSLLLRRRAALYRAVGEWALADADDRAAERPQAP